MAPKKHLRMRKGFIVGVVAFAWFLSMLFSLQEFIIFTIGGRPVGSL